MTIAATHNQMPTLMLLAAIALALLAAYLGEAWLAPHADPLMPVDDCGKNWTLRLMAIEPNCAIGSVSDESVEAVRKTFPPQNEPGVVYTESTLDKALYFIEKIIWGR